MLVLLYSYISATIIQMQQFEDKKVEMTYKTRKGNRTHPLVWLPKTISYFKLFNR